MVTLQCYWLLKMDKLLQPLAVMFLDLGYFVYVTAIGIKKRRKYFSTPDVFIIVITYLFLLVFRFTFNFFSTTATKRK